VLKLIMAVGSIVLLSAAGTTALERPSIKACDSDLKQSCAGEKAPLKCLKTNYNAVSDSCKDFVRAAVVSKVCAQDIKTFCPGILSDHVKFADCMTRKWEKISDTCQPYLLVYPTDKKWGTMLITEPNKFVAEFHDRMPVILEAKDFEQWERGDAKDAAALKWLAGEARPATFGH
jgi:hypothetical protein